MQKINCKRIPWTRLGFYIIIAGLIVLLFYTRLINLEWGLPYHMHPDERNMVNAILELKCDFSQIRECLNPNFFAYGQFPLYFVYFFLIIYSQITNIPIGGNQFSQATVILRSLSAAASIFAVGMMWNIVKILILRLFPRVQKYQLIILLCLLIGIFSPGLIQFAHFGTTESLLLFFYTYIVYITLEFLFNKRTFFSFLILSSFTCGLAIATKTSSLLFLFIPIIALFIHFKTHILSVFRRENFNLQLKSFIRFCIKLLLDIGILISLSFLIFLFFSPHTLIHFQDFLGSMKYESSVAFGSYIAFYTRQFFYTIPGVFQFYYVFPYVLGWPIFIFFILGFLFLPRKREINFIRFAILIYGIPQIYLFAKWTRFVMPIIPLMIVIAVLFLIRLFEFSENIENRILLRLKNYKHKFIVIYKIIKNLFYLLIIIIAIIPGITYLSIYQNRDVRLFASEWIYKNISENSLILSETANVVDIPLRVESQKVHKMFNVISFNFYDVDENMSLRKDLEFYIKNADYIFVPSRRVYANHTCLQPSIFPQKIHLTTLSKQNLNQKQLSDKCNNLQITYPILNQYYNDLFSGKLGFQQVAQFSSFPFLTLFGKKLIEFPDEQSEETWSVFDHPVIRIYKRITQN